MQPPLPKAAVHEPAAFFSLIRHPLRFRLYLLKNLPAGFFSGLKIETANATACAVSVPFKWLTQNPFRSTYFASLGMAAEMSTGVLAMAQVYQRKPSVSMLVSGLEARFYKKAMGRTFFTCADGESIALAIDRTSHSGEAIDVKAYSIGRNSAGETVAEFWVTWSFKRR